MRAIIDRAIRPLGLRLVKARLLDILYQHDYAGGYEEYRAAQKRYKRPIEEGHWADGKTLSAVADNLESCGLGRSGVCHGARNGWEVAWLRDRLKADIIGTDIKDAAARFPHMVVHDFHEPNPEWEGRFDFVYTNTLDHAFDPPRALRTWAKQIQRAGRIYIEHTFRGHGVAATSEVDPFGAHPFVMPYLFFEWGRGCFELADILKPGAKDTNGMEAWVFVLNASRD